MRVVAKLICSACGHQFDNCVRRDAFGDAVYATKNERVAGDGCLREYTFTEQCTGTIVWKRHATIARCSRCSRDYDLSWLGKKCDQFRHRDPQTGRVFHCEGLIREARNIPLLGCTTCDMRYTIGLLDGVAQCVSTRDVDRITPVQLAKIVRGIPTEEPGRFVIQDLSHEITYSNEGSAIIPDRYRIKLDGGFTPENRMTARWKNLPAEVLDPYIQVRQESPGVGRALAKCAALAGTACVRIHHMIGRCRGIVQAIPIEVPLDGVREYNPLTIGKGFTITPPAEVSKVIESSETSGKAESNGTSEAADQVSTN